MTNDIAIRFCDEYLARHISDIDKEFLKKAKETLQQESCEDAISRQAVLDVIEKAVTKEVARWSIKELPPVNPQKLKTGCCKDCNHFCELPHHTETLGRCTLHDLRFYPKGDWYCADFEPKGKE